MCLFIVRFIVQIIIIGWHVALISMIIQLKWQCLPPSHISSALRNVFVSWATKTMIVILCDTHQVHQPVLHLIPFDLNIDTWHLILLEQATAIDLRFSIFCARLFLFFSTFLASNSTCTGNERACVCVENGVSMEIEDKRSKNYSDKKGSAWNVIISNPIADYIVAECTVTSWAEKTEQNSYVSRQLVQKSNCIQVILRRRCEWRR